MADAQLSGWNRARTFHGVSLNQPEQEHCTWMDEEEKLKFHRALVWHLASFSHSAPPLPGFHGGPVNAATSPPTEYNTAASPGTNACQAYNTMGCDQGEASRAPAYLLFCLISINCSFPHSETDCMRKGHKHLASPMMDNLCS